MKEADSTPESGSAPLQAESADEPVDKPSQAASTQQERSVHLSVTREQVLASAFRGPIPPPKILSDYEAVFPGCAERIVEMAERQSSHRQDLESTSLRSNTLVERRGQIFAFIITMTAIAGGTYLISIGRDATGITSIISALGVLAGTFIYGKHVEAEERKQKRQPFEERESNDRQRRLFHDDPNGHE